MHVTGQGFSEWAVLSVSMGWGSVDGGAEGLLPNDDRLAGRGITFWARIGDTSIEPGARSRSATSIRGRRAASVSNGGSTDVACYDTHGVDLTQLVTTWQQYRIPFGGLAQRNFGLHAGSSGREQHLHHRVRSRPRRSMFDFWVDDMKFY